MSTAVFKRHSGQPSISKDLEPKKLGKGMFTLAWGIKPGRLRKFCSYAPTLDKKAFCYKPHFYVIYIFNEPKDLNDFNDYNTNL